MNPSVQLQIGNETAYLYLDLLKRCLANFIYQDPAIPMPPEENEVFDPETRRRGRDRPSQAHTMIGLNRLENIQALVEDVLRNGVPGDLIETGVARGGATIFMRGILKAYGVADRKVWVADSFGKFPRSAESGLTRRSYTSPYWAEITTVLNRYPEQFERMMTSVNARTSYEEVREHFGRYGLLDDQVEFLVGWFCDTLPSASIESLALLRIDADLYDSTYEPLTRLYPRLSDGGHVIVDDYHSFPECKAAVDDYLREHGLTVRLQVVDEAVHWRKSPGG
uniref:Putative methyl transferase n=1 Tax=Streptomyces argenteolus TaxID=67274 RepID=A9ZNV0_9ACTN|nr:putative methyl transferase [Streptomyces argenteolus]